MIDKNNYFKKYQSKYLKQVSLRFNINTPEDMEIFEKFNKEKNKTKLVKKLLKIYYL